MSRLFPEQWARYSREVPRWLATKWFRNQPAEDNESHSTTSE
jgi:hypothetical protein